MIQVRPVKALGHTWHLRLAIAKLEGWIAASDVPDADKPQYAARIKEYQRTLTLYRSTWGFFDDEQKGTAVEALKREAVARNNPEYTDDVIANTLSWLGGEDVPLPTPEPVQET